MKAMPAFTAAFDGIEPQTGALAYAGQGAAILGRATLGDGAWLGARSVIRADGNFIDIGAGFHLGAHGTVHITHDFYPTNIGEDVVAGDDSVIHACTIGDGCVIGAGAIILDGAVIGDHACLETGAIVFPRATLEGRWRYAGSPAKPVAKIDPADLAKRREAVKAASMNREDAPHARPQVQLDCFVAPSARLIGGISAGDKASIWYGCILDAGSGKIEIGTGTNIQDNTIMSAGAGAIIIGSDVTIGHNVKLGPCHIASGSLIGIGARLASGTYVESDVLVAAGAQAEPGQRLSSGHVWGGSPARIIGPLDEKKREMMKAIPPIYRDGAEQFRTALHTQISVSSSSE